MVCRKVDDQDKAKELILVYINSKELGGCWLQEWADRKTFQAVEKDVTLYLESHHVDMKQLKVMVSSDGLGTLQIWTEKKSDREKKDLIYAIN